MRYVSYLLYSHIESITDYSLYKKKMQNMDASQVNTICNVLYTKNCLDFELSFSTGCLFRLP